MKLDDLSPPNRLRSAEERPRRSPARVLCIPISLLLSLDIRSGPRKSSKAQERS